MEKQGCARCQIFVDAWDRPKHSMNEDQLRTHKRRVLDGMEQMFLKAGCDKMGLICLPLQRLEHQEERTESKNISRSKTPTRP